MVWCYRFVGSSKRWQKTLTWNSIGFVIFLTSFGFSSVIKWVLLDFLDAMKTVWVQNDELSASFLGFIFFFGDKFFGTMTKPMFEYFILLVFVTFYVVIIFVRSVLFWRSMQIISIQMMWLIWRRKCYRNMLKKIFRKFNAKNTQHNIRIFSFLTTE